jgi:hypothetical protein
VEPVARSAPPAPEPDTDWQATAHSPTVVRRDAKPDLREEVHDSFEPATSAMPTNSSSRRQLPTRLEQVEDGDRQAEFGPPPPYARQRNGPEDGARTRGSSRDSSNAVRTIDRQPAYVDFSRGSSGDTIYLDPVPRPRDYGRMVLFGLALISQLAVAAMASVSFYLTVGQRGARVERGDSTSPGEAAKVQAPAPPLRPNAITAIPSKAAPAPPSVALVDSVMPAPAPPPFPRPETYGVYAINSGALVELEQVAATAVDPRTRNQLQILSPARAMLAGARATFVLYRRDLMLSAPERVKVRVAARIARTMNFDPMGKPVTTIPTTESWLIRDQGYDLRVSPLRDSPEMVIVRPGSDDFIFPAGRYELMVGGQPYDFLIAGEITDPAHCVEGVATVRGPAFYECKPP